MNFHINNNKNLIIEAEIDDSNQLEAIIPWWTLFGLVVIAYDIYTSRNNVMTLYLFLSVLGMIPSVKKSIDKWHMAGKFFFIFLAISIIIVIFENSWIDDIFNFFKNLVS